MRTDVHQHLWSEPLVAALVRRARPPRVRLRAGSWILELPGEPECEIAVDDIDARTNLVAVDDLDRALISLSSPLGIEALPHDEAWPLIAAYHDGAFALPSTFGVWGAIALDEPDPTEAEAILDRGAVGLALPAGALSSPRELDRIDPVLAVLERHDAPLFVHPGPAPWTPRGAGSELPPWWPALTTYVAEQAAAWLTFVTRGRRAHPRLRIVFAMLGGLGPLHEERLRARGGPFEDIADPRVFFDTSSYGHRAIRAMAAAVGPTQLVHGSDRPVVVPSLGDVLGDGQAALRVDNPARLLGHVPVFA